MPYNPTYPTLLDACKTIDICQLRRLSYLVPATRKDCIISWQQDGGETASVHLIIDMLAPNPYVTIEYTGHREEIKYQVSLSAKPSNLGKGFLWYFICPRTGKPCSKLYFDGKYFLHRTALENAAYYRDTCAHANRSLLKQFRKTETLENAGKYLDAKYRKTHYRGKPTKKYKAIERMVHYGI